MSEYPSKEWCLEMALREGELEAGGRSRHDYLFHETIEAVLRCTICAERVRAYLAAERAPASKWELTDETVDAFLAAHRAHIERGGHPRGAVRAGIAAVGVSLSVPPQETAPPRKPRIPYGEERRFGAISPPTGPCHDCGALVGVIHDEGCDWEECETCGGQRIGCCCCVVCRAHEDAGTWVTCAACIERARGVRG